MRPPCRRRHSGSNNRLQRHTSDTHLLAPWVIIMSMVYVVYFVYTTTMKARPARGAPQQNKPPLTQEDKTSRSNIAMDVSSELS